MPRTLIDTYEFSSPINLEGSWGTRSLSNQSTSKMQLYLNGDDTGDIEWEVPSLDLYEEIGLTFEIDAQCRRTLIDYDGVMTLPDQAMDLMERNGIDVTEMRATLRE